MIDLNWEYFTNCWLGYWLIGYGVVSIPVHHDILPCLPHSSAAAPGPKTSSPPCLQPGGSTCSDPWIVQGTFRQAAQPSPRPPFPCCLSGHLDSCYKCFEQHSSGGIFNWVFLSDLSKDACYIFGCLFGYFFMDVQAIL